MKRFEIIFGRGSYPTVIYVKAESREVALVQGRLYSKKYLGGQRIATINETPACENCGEKPSVYAMGSSAGDWGGRYCDAHIPTGFRVTDRY